VTIDGRNPCPEAEANPPRWRIERVGTIAIDIGVHHGRIHYALAFPPISCSWPKTTTASKSAENQYEQGSPSRRLRRADVEQADRSPIGAVTKTGSPIVVVTDRCAGRRS
jgi:hypothetical protein